ncbi:MAG: hypothetical protein AVDCRST_MAG59-4965 [uncultured Thermomicrobiales bacterium]|uniref:P/Homo B domain-containing protein n=1 Tax=uncultured Thermomicrobiales bacterium TaxID=1645740 RepID=A0A6J4VL39_9BACT|nr:MAG: hypothetical protein AVDCRST_MAG59-4965 [uncultured Thermomicrobiales bacterium]
MKVQEIARRSRTIGWSGAYGLLAGLLLVPALVLGPSAVDGAAAERRGGGVEAEDFAARTFRGTIVIGDAAPASPYGSTVTVSGLRGRVRDVNVILNDFSHQNPEDVAVMLATRGRAATLMRAVGGGTDVENANILLDEESERPLPDDGPLAGGLAYRPAVGDPEGEKEYPFYAEEPFGGEAPDPNYDEPDEEEDYAPLSFFDGLTANGDWTLWVRDDVANNLGGSTSGWTLEIVTDVPAGEFIARDRYRIVQGQVLTVGAEQGVLRKVDERGDLEFAARLVARPTKGKVRLNADGSFTYTPDAGALRKDAFTYRIEDEFGSSIAGTGRVVIRIGRP